MLSVYRIGCILRGGRLGSLFATGEGWENKINLFNRADDIIMDRQRQFRVSFLLFFSLSLIISSFEASANCGRAFKSLKLNKVSSSQYRKRATLEAARHAARREAANPTIDQVSSTSGQEEIQSLLARQLIDFELLYNQKQFKKVNKLTNELNARGLLTSETSDFYDTGDLYGYLSIYQLSREIRFVDNLSKAALSKQDSNVISPDHWHSLLHALEKDQIETPIRIKNSLNIELSLKGFVSFAESFRNLPKYQQLKAFKDFEGLVGIQFSNKGIHIRIEDENGQISGYLIDKNNIEVEDLLTVSDLGFTAALQEAGDTNLARLTYLPPDPAENREATYVVHSSDKWDRGIELTESELVELEHFDPSDSVKPNAYKKVAAHFEDQMGNGPVLFWEAEYHMLPGKQRQAREHLANVFQRAFPDKPMFIDDWNSAVVNKAKDLASLNLGLRQVSIIVDGSKDPIPLQSSFVRPLQKLKKQEPYKSNLDLIEVNQDSMVRPSWGEDHRGVIVFSAHQSEKLEKFIDKLGEFDYLRNQAVVFESCGEGLSDYLVAKMTQKYGATAVYRHPGKITSQLAVEQVSGVLKRLAANDANDNNRESLFWRFLNPGDNFSDPGTRPDPNPNLNPGGGGSGNAVKGNWSVCEIPTLIKTTKDLRV